MWCIIRCLEMRTTISHKRHGPIQAPQPLLISGPLLVPLRLRLVPLLHFGDPPRARDRLGLVVPFLLRQLPRALLLAALNGVAHSLLLVRLAPRGTRSAAAASSASRCGADSGAPCPPFALLLLENRCPPLLRLRSRATTRTLPTPWRAVGERVGKEEERRKSRRVRPRSRPTWVTRTPLPTRLR